jgi:phospholipid-binding lipoprotein MlaA
MKRVHNRWLIALCVGFIALSGCTKMPQNQQPEQAIDEDPLEPMNRFVFEFNKIVDNVLLRPITVVYRTIVPEPGREMVSNALVNLYTPVVFGNSVLQGDPQNSFATLWRFLINSTVGIGGAFDVASEAGLKNRPADFGQTLAMYGAEPGPYIVLPLIGPSNGRDAVGRLADAFMNPFNYIDEGFSYAMWGAGAVDARSNNMKLIDDVYKTSLDPYATFRSGYTQKRASDIRRAETERAKSLEKAGF